MTRVSIIIPTYNSERTLGNTIESILLQSFEDFEVLIMDNISVDGTLTIAHGFNDKRIQVYSEKDRGIYDAMNKGIERSNGEWLYFLGSDDFLFSNDVLKNISAVVFDSDVIYGNVHSSRFYGIYDGEFDENKIQNRNICHQAIFFNKAVFKKTGKFDTYFKALSDWDHNFKWFFNETIKRKYVNIVVAEYADGGFSSTMIDKSFLFLKDWKLMIMKRGRLSMTSRIIFFYNLCKNLYRKRRRRDLAKVILELPSLLF